MSAGAITMQGETGSITLRWLAHLDPLCCASTKIAWRQGERLASLPDSIEAHSAGAALHTFPWALLRDVKAYSRWGMQLRWESPIYLDDELAILAEVSADARQWRQERARARWQAGRRIVGDRGR